MMWGCQEEYWVWGEMLERSTRHERERVRKRNIEEKVYGLRKGQKTVCLRRVTGCGYGDP